MSEDASEWQDALVDLLALAARFEGEGQDNLARLAALLQGLSDDALTQSASDGGWAIRNTVTHLRDAQDVLAFRLERFRQAERPTLEAKAVWTWATSEEARPPTTLEIYERYRASRVEMLAKLEELLLAHWWRVGWHEEFGAVTLRQQVSYFAAHEITHLPQIAALSRRFIGGE